MRESKNVIVHGRQGIGRSALIAAALLVLTGADPNNAIYLVAKARNRNVPESDEQQEWMTQLREKPRLVTRS